MGQRGTAAGAGQGDPTGVPCNGGDRVAFWGRVLPGYRVLSKAGTEEGESLPAARPIDRTIILQRERERERGTDHSTKLPRERRPKKKVRGQEKE